MSTTPGGNTFADQGGGDATLPRFLADDGDDEPIKAKNEESQKIATE